MPQAQGSHSTLVSPPCQVSPTELALACHPEALPAELCGQ